MSTLYFLTLSVLLTTNINQGQRSVQALPDVSALLLV